MNDRVMMENERGEWVPAIPLPFHSALVGFRCGCGRRFWTRQQYNEHYAYEHIVMGRPER